MDALNKVLKRITVLLLVMTLMIVGSGCKMNLYSEETLQKKAIRYMEKKYGEEALFSIKRGYAEAKVYKIYVKVQEHDDWDIRVFWDFEKKEFTDNYMSWVFKEKVEEAFYPIFEEVYGTCKIFNSPYGFQVSNHYSNDTELEDYLETVNASDFCVFTTSDAEKKERDLQVLCDQIQKKGWDAYVRVLYVSEETFINTNRSNYEEHLKKRNYTWRTSVRVSKNRENFIDQWEEGERSE